VSTARAPYFQLPQTHTLQPPTPTGPPHRRRLRPAKLTTTSTTHKDLNHQHNKTPPSAQQARSTTTQSQFNPRHKLNSNRILAGRRREPSQDRYETTRTSTTTTDTSTILQRHPGRGRPCTCPRTIPLNRGSASSSVTNSARSSRKTRTRTATIYRGDTQTPAPNHPLGPTPNAISFAPTIFFTRHPRRSRARKELRNVD